MAKDKGKAKSSDDQDELFEDGDDSLVINMNDVEESSFELVPKGNYDCVIETLEYKLSNSSGKPMWAVVLAIADGTYSGQKLFTNISFSEKAISMAKSAIMKFAPEVLNDSFNPKKIADSGQLSGRRCRVKTKIEPYEGEDRTKVAGCCILPYGIEICQGR